MTQLLNPPTEPDAALADDTGNPRLRIGPVLARLLPVAGLVGLVAFFGITAGDRFLTFDNGASLVQQAAVVMIIGFGLTFVILAGCIDLSVGSVAAFAATVAALVAVDQGSMIGLLAGLGIGAGCGLVNGLLCAVCRIPSFIVTLAMLSVARGLTVVVSDSSATVVDGALRWTGGTPGIYVVLALTFVVAALLLNGTTFGRYARAIGGEERVSVLSGVPVTRIKTLVFVVSGMTAALGGMVLAGQLGVATPQAAISYELSAIAAVVLGGTPLTGGIGSIWNTCVGALIIVVLGNGLVILGVASEIQQIIQGGILVLAVFLALDRSKIGVIK
ncbi:MAG: ABC transporter permease [Actinomycetota bacterium]|nr:ABC transporter permease [Actinomycetota bacterium]